MSKPALGRGLEDLLQTAAPEKSARPPASAAGAPGAEGGVATLLRGKAETRPAPASAGRARPGPHPPGPRLSVVWSLVVADLGLAVAGVLIARQNPFSLAPWTNLFGLALIALGGWFGCLGWSLSREPACGETSPDQFFKR